MQQRQHQHAVLLNPPPAVQCGRAQRGLCTFPNNAPPWPYQSHRIPLALLKPHLTSSSPKSEGMKGFLAGRCSSGSAVPLRHSCARRGPVALCMCCANHALRAGVQPAQCGWGMHPGQRPDQRGHKKAKQDLCQPSKPQPPRPLCTHTPTCSQSAGSGPAAYLVPYQRSVSVHSACRDKGERLLCIRALECQCGAAAQFRRAVGGKERERDGAARTSRVLEDHSTRAFSGVRSATTWAAGPEETLRPQQHACRCAQTTAPTTAACTTMPCAWLPGTRPNAQRQPTHLLDQRFIVFQRHAVRAQQQLGVAVNLHSRNSTRECCGHVPAKVAAGWVAGPQAGRQVQWQQPPCRSQCTPLHQRPLTPASKLHLSTAPTGMACSECIHAAWKQQQQQQQPLINTNAISMQPQRSPTCMACARLEA